MKRNQKQRLLGNRQSNPFRALEIRLLRNNELNSHGLVPLGRH